MAREKRILFIGNSATYVQDIPGMLARLATEAGYPLQTACVASGGATLAQYADPRDSRGEAAGKALEKPYDVVFLQDNGNCISNAERRRESENACRILCARIAESGARAAFYVRPPYGYEKWGMDPLEQCRELDRLFLPLGEELEAIGAPVNRAFAEAIRSAELRLWGEDNAHLSERGAYLAVCMIFRALTGEPAARLGQGGLPAEAAECLREIADRTLMKGAWLW